MRILLIRTSALGDVVHCLPVLTALRRHWPDATLGWVIEEALLPLIEGHPDLDEVIPVRLRKWRHHLGRRETWRQIRTARGRLRSFRADVVLDLMGNHKAGALAFVSGCRRRIGLAKKDRREPSSALWINEQVPAPRPHAVDRALAVLAALEVPAEPVDFGGDKLFRGARLPEDLPEKLGGELPPRFALLPPGAGWHNKRYPTASWGRVARRLAEEAGVVTLLPCGPGEEPLAEAVAEAAGSLGDGTPAAHSLGLVSLPGLAALMRRAALVMGGDSGPTHLAQALGAPVLCVHGPTDPARHGPYGAPGHAVVRPLPCSFCYKRFDEPKACLLALPPEAVAERALALLESPGILKDATGNTQISMN